MIFGARSHLIVAITLYSTWAFADVPPPDRCDLETVGKPCDNALAEDGSKKQGLCAKATCSRASPKGKIEYECGRCEASQAPAPTPSATTAPVESSQPSASAQVPAELPKPVSPTPASPVTKGGCNFGLDGAPGHAGAVGGALMALAAFMRRRRGR